MAARRPQPVTFAPAEFRLRREAMCLTQAELAARLGIETRQVQRYEAGDAIVPALVVYSLKWLAQEPSTSSSPPRRT